MVILMSLLHLIDRASPSFTVIAFNAPHHQRQIQYLTSSTTTRNTGTGVTRTRRMQRGRSVQLQRQRTSSMQLLLMNWFGFGNNKNDDENGSGRVNDSNLPSDISSTILLSSSLKEFNGKSSNNGSRSGGSSGGVVTIMDSMDQLKRSQRIGKITATLVQELKSITVEGSSENGKIKITLDGQQNPISTFIDESYFREQQQQPQRSTSVDTNELAKAITVAMKDARIKSIEKMNEKMKNVYNELGFYNTSP